MTTVEQNVAAPEKVSQSLLARMDVCPHSAFLYLKHHDLRLQSHAMARGEAFHEFAERFIGVLAEAGEGSAPGEVGKVVMQEVIASRTDLVLPAAEQDALGAMAWNFAEGMRFDLSSIAAVEQMFEASLSGWPIRGRLDLVEVSGGEVRIVDWKTSLAIPAQEKIQPEGAGIRDFQLGFYALLAAEGWLEDHSANWDVAGINRFVCRLVFPRYRSGDGNLVYREAVLDRAMIHDFKGVLESHLDRLSNGLDTGVWPASAGSHCSTCPAPTECPIPHELRATDSIGSPGQASEQAERWLMLDKETKRVWGSLKEWAKENGEIELGDYELGFTYSESESLKPGMREAAKLAIESTEADPSQFFTRRQSTRFGKRQRNGSRDG